MIRFHIPEKLDRKKPYVWLASWFGCGFISPAPGTWGTLGGLPFGILIYALGGVYTLMIAVIIITLIGIWAAERFDKSMQSKDNKMIVIDEVAGIWIALIPTGLNPLYILLAFVLFRLLDITKPSLIGVLDRNIKGALGVMADDIAAGLITALFVMVLGTYI